MVKVHLGIRVDLIPWNGDSNAQAWSTNFARLIPLNAISEISIGFRDVIFSKFSNYVQMFNFDKICVREFWNNRWEIQNFIMSQKFSQTGIQSPNRNSKPNTEYVTLWSVTDCCHPLLVHLIRTMSKSMPNGTPQNSLKRALEPLAQKCSGAPLQTAPTQISARNLVRHSRSGPLSRVSSGGCRQCRKSHVAPSWTRQRGRYTLPTPKISPNPLPSLETFPPIFPSPVSLPLERESPPSSTDAAAQQARPPRR
jgi:hypothetical protein